jgi:hypothetical protein
MLHTRGEQNGTKLKAAELLFARFAWVITHLYNAQSAATSTTHPSQKHRTGRGRRQLLLSSRAINFPAHWK